MSVKYKRILLKLSGESLAGEKKQGIDSKTLREICKAIKKSHELGVDISIVVGGGNFWRGRTNEHMNRTRADHVGMLATLMNGICVCDALEQLGVDVRVQSAVNMQQLAEPYIRGKAIRHLEKNRILIFSCGTGSPYFSTDTAAALRAAETNSDVIFKATMVDGVYDKDPNKFNDAKRFKEISYMEVLNKNLQVMDMTAASLCRDNNIPTYVFSIKDPQNIVKAILGEDIGTLVH